MVWKAFAGAAFLWLGCAVAHAAVVYDNGGPTTSGSSAGLWVQADDFRLNSGATLKGGTIYVADQDGGATWAGLGHPLQWYIFADDGGKPGSAPLATGAGQNLIITNTGISWGFGGNFQRVDFNFGSNFAAAANTDYWLGIHLTNSFTLDPNVFWGATQANATALGHESNGGTFDNWNLNPTELQKAFSLNSEIVPLPSSLLMALSGFSLLGGGALARRRRSGDCVR